MIFVPTYVPMSPGLFLNLIDHTIGNGPARKSWSKCLLCKPITSEANRRWFTGFVYIVGWGLYVIFLDKVSTWIPFNALTLLTHRRNSIQPTKKPTLIILKLSLFGSSRTSKGYINNHQVCASVALETKIQLYVRSHKTFRESEKDLHRYFNFQNVCINMFR